MSVNLPAHPTVRGGPSRCRPGRQIRAIDPEAVVQAPPREDVRVEVVSTHEPRGAPARSAVVERAPAAGGASRERQNGKRQSKNQCVEEPGPEAMRPRGAAYQEVQAA